MDQQKEVFMMQAEFFQGVRKTYCLQAIYDLKINDILNEHDDFMSTEEICSKITGRTIIAKYLDKFMRYLAAFGVFEEKHVNGILKFKTTEFLKVDEVLFYTKVYQIESRFMDLLEGKTGDKSLFEYVHGYNTWDLLTKEPYGSNFRQHGKHSNAILTESILPKLIDEIRKEDRQNAVIVDVGGSNGYMSKEFHKNFPLMKCINFDLPEVISILAPIEGVEMMSGDMFKVDTLPKCDVIFNKSVLHDFSDDECAEILNNFHKVLPDDGLLLTVDNHVIEGKDIGPQTWFSRGGDMLMMELFANAGWRSQADFQRLHEKAGFKVKRYVILSQDTLPVAIMICEK